MAQNIAMIQCQAIPICKEQCLHHGSYGFLPMLNLLWTMLISFHIHLIGLTTILWVQQLVIVKLPLEKSISEELGFNRLQLNSMYVQNSRGKYEMQILSALKQPMFDVRKFSWDMSLFLSQEFNLLKINKKYLTGSSIMPNKNNPDVIELLRANYAILAGQSSELENLISLPSGYHRDLQLTKKSLVESFQTVMKSLRNSSRLN